MGKMVCNTQQRGNYCKGDIDIYIYVYRPDDQGGGELCSRTQDAEVKTAFPTRFLHPFTPPSNPQIPG